jgi:hypothetical protein
MKGMNGCVKCRAGDQDMHCGTSLKYILVERFGSKKQREITNSIPYSAKAEAKPIAGCILLI